MFFEAVCRFEKAEPVWGVADEEGKTKAEASPLAADHEELEGT